MRVVSDVVSWRCVGTYAGSVCAALQAASRVGDGVHALTKLPTVVPMALAIHKFDMSDTFLSARRWGLRGGGLNAKRVSVGRGTRISGVGRTEHFCE